jgi:hypothetical protein
MKRQRKLLLGGALIAGVAALGVGQVALDASAPDRVEAPMFQVDPFWPKPLPNNWILGNVIGVGVDSDDHVFIVHRSSANLSGPLEAGAEQTPPTSECCIGAPPVLEFDTEGNLLNAWGGEDGPGYVWPGSNHGISVDHMDNVWIGGNGGTDSHMLKFTNDGRFLAQIGTPNAGPCDSNSLTRFCQVAKVSFDWRSNEAFVADGYGNVRVAVVDMNTNQIVRYWGAYGNRPDDSFDLGPRGPDNVRGQQFRGPVHCADPSNDGFVYVCDRQNNRIQVFRRDGTFVSETFINPATLGDGATWDTAFSRDPAQTYLYVADGKNHKVHVLDRRSMTVLYSFGMGGKNPGQFFATHSIATDSKGNIFTTETYEGKRVQKFTYMGMGTVTQQHVPAVWPSR